MLFAATEFACATGALFARRDYAHARWCLARGEQPQAITAAGASSLAVARFWAALADFVATGAAPPAWLDVVGAGAPFFHVVAGAVAVRAPA